MIRIKIMPFNSGNTKYRVVYRLSIKRWTGKRRRIIRSSSFTRADDCNTIDRDHGGFFLLAMKVLIYGGEKFWECLCPDGSCVILENLPLVVYTILKKIMHVRFLRCKKEFWDQTYMPISCAAFNTYETPWRRLTLVQRKRSFYSRKDGEKMDLSYQQIVSAIPPLSLSAGGYFTIFLQSRGKRSKRSKRSIQISEPGSGCIGKKTTSGLMRFWIVWKGGGKSYLTGSWSQRCFSAKGWLV